jgi:hypothetical protein
VVCIQQEFLLSCEFSYHEAFSSISQSFLKQKETVIFFFWYNYVYKWSLNSCVSFTYKHRAVETSWSLLELGRVFRGLLRATCML